MVIIDTEKIQKMPFSKHCDICDFTCSKQSNYTTHLLTSKHIKRYEMIQNCQYIKPENATPKFKCQCGKIFTYNSGLWRHNKICKYSDTLIPDELTDKQLIMKLLQENAEMRKALVETCNKGQSNLINNNSNNTNNNSHNKTFNLQFFLNETCKDAININDFVSSIQLQLTDLETTGRVGYVEGISKIILHKLNDMEQYHRPMHCSDIKREIMYIKDNDEWTKEDTAKPLLTRAIKIIANENIKKINEWKLKNPNCTDSDSKKNNTYLNIVSNAMSGASQEETNKNIGKIISNIVKETQIDK